MSDPFTGLKNPIRMPHQQYSNYHYWLMDELKAALPSEEFEAVKDAPLNWIETLYPHVKKFGGEIIHVIRLFESWVDRPDDAKALINLAAEAEHRRIMAFTDTSIGRVLAGDARRLLAREEITLNLINMFLNEDLTSMVKFSVVEDGLYALQVRSAIKDKRLRFSQEDYDFMTRFLRTNWGRIHPDDEDLM